MKWDKEKKEKIAYLFASIAFLFGIGLTIASFCVPPIGVINGSVLWVLGQCFVFSASVTGISLHIDNAKQQIKSELEQEIKKE